MIWKRRKKNIFYQILYILMWTNIMCDRQLFLNDKNITIYKNQNKYRDCHGRERMVVRFTTTCAISAYHHQFEYRSWRGVRNTTLCDKVCQWLATGQWFSLGTLVSSTDKTDRNDIAEILLKVALNTNTLTPNFFLTTSILPFTRTKINMLTIWK